MQLVEQGKVELDGEVDAILPEVAGAEILDPVTGLRRKAVNKVTLRMLLSHTA
jgi:CubicO group peptidase (beta-lactamase class C family)